VCAELGSSPIEKQKMVSYRWKTVQLKWKTVNYSLEDGPVEI
jgi:hypothetical protein